MKTTEQLARKLFQIFDKVKTDSMYGNHLRWKGVAKEVQRMIIEANIAQLKVLKNMPKKQSYIVDTIAELEEMLDDS